MLGKILSGVLLLALATPASAQIAVASFQAAWPVSSVASTLDPLENLPRRT